MVELSLSIKEKRIRIFGKRISLRFMATYRIKTEEEFIKEFGISWDIKVTYTWCSSMHHFHNKIVEIQEFPGFIDGWAISKDMVVLIKNPILKLDKSLLEQLVASKGVCNDLECSTCPIHFINKNNFGCVSSLTVDMQTNIAEQARILLEIRNRLEGK